MTEEHDDMQAVCEEKAKVISNEPGRKTAMTYNLRARKSPREVSIERRRGEVREVSSESRWKKAMDGIQSVGEEKSKVVSREPQWKKAMTYTLRAGQSRKEVSSKASGKTAMTYALQAGQGRRWSAAGHNGTEEGNDIPTAGEERSKVVSRERQRKKAMTYKLWARKS
ncbi:hypothetical protein B0H13DRAFT_1906657 [Mycena leptocephala]|nr:hypothetical protein B0H13DRAFT_1906657 [Mycena leptocephala]